MPRSVFPQEVSSAASFVAPSTLSASKGKSAAFVSRSGRFASPVAQGSSSLSYDTTHGTMGAAAQRSFNKSGSKSKGSFGGGASRDTMAWGVKQQSTPRNSVKRSDEVAHVASIFGVKDRQSKGPAFGGGKGRFAPAKDATPAADFAPAGMGTVKKSRAKSPAMGGNAGRFEKTREAYQGDYSGAYTSDFGKAPRPGASSKSSSKAGKGVGFGGTVPRVSAVEAAAREAAKNAPDAIYDVYSKTGAFASASSKAGGGNRPSAAFASKAPKHSATKPSDAPDPGLYNTYGVGSMAQSSKSFNKSLNAGTGGFGTSASRDTGASLATAEATPGPGAYTAVDESAFAAQSSAKPSAAFASATGAGARLAAVDVTDAPSSVLFDPNSLDGMAATALKTFNKTRSTMGRSERMAPAKEAAPGEFLPANALPGAFTASKPASVLSNMGFGGQASRAALFQEAAAAAAPDTYYVGAGAFDLKPSSGPSAAFKSTSGKSALSTKPSEVGDPGAYNPYEHTSIAASTSKSFSKTAQRGAGGFGTSAKARGDAATRDEHVPGPGAYDATDGLLFERDAYKPSAAFASESEARPDLRASAAPSGVAYDPHKDDGMAAVATRTFNTKAGTSAFGGQQARQMHDVKPTPGPGEYREADPNAPTVDSSIKATRGKMSGSFASGALRDSEDWAALIRQNQR